VIVHGDTVFCEGPKLAVEQFLSQALFGSPHFAIQRKARRPSWQRAQRAPNRRKSKYTRQINAVANKSR
jgi:hypothetical protein